MEQAGHLPCGKRPRADALAGRDNLQGKVQAPNGLCEQAVSQLLEPHLLLSLPFPDAPTYVTLFLSWPNTTKQKLLSNLSPRDSTTNPDITPLTKQPSVHVHL